MATNTTSVSTTITQINTTTTHSGLFPRVLYICPPTPDHCDRTHPISIGYYKNIEMYKKSDYHSDHFGEHEITRQHNNQLISSHQIYQPQN